MSGCRQGVPWVGEAGREARAIRAGRRAAGASHLHLRGAQAAAAAPRAVGLRRLRAGLDVLPQLAAGELGPAVVGARDDDHLALAREVAAHVAALAHPLAPALAEGAERLQVRDEAVGEPVWEHLRGLDLGAALGARGRAVYPFGDAGSAEYMPVAGGRP